MKKVIVAIFLIILLSLLYVSSNVFVSANCIAKNIQIVKKYDDKAEPNVLQVGDYKIENLSKLNSFEEIDYISFNMDNKYINMLFDIFNVVVVSKYVVFDKIVYDCHSDKIPYNNKINIQIIVGDETQVGIPTKFSGF